MDEKFFADLQEGLLIKSLYLTSGESLSSNIPSWKVTTVNEEFIEIVDTSHALPSPKLLGDLGDEEVTTYTTNLRIRKAVVAGIEYLVIVTRNPEGKGNLGV